MDTYIMYYVMRHLIIHGTFSMVSVQIAHQNIYQYTVHPYRVPLHVRIRITLSSNVLTKQIINN